MPLVTKAMTSKFLLVSLRVGLRNCSWFCYTSHHQERLGWWKSMTNVTFPPEGGFLQFQNIQFTDLSAIVKIQVLW